MTDHTKTREERHPRQGLLRYAAKVHGFRVTMRADNGEETILHVVPEHHTSAHAAAKVRQEIIDTFGADKVLKIEDFEAHQWRTARGADKL